MYEKPWLMSMYSELSWHDICCPFLHLLNRRTYVRFDGLTFTLIISVVFQCHFAHLVWGYFIKYLKCCVLFVDPRATISYEKKTFNDTLFGCHFVLKIQPLYCNLSRTSSSTNLNKTIVHIWFVVYKMRIGVEFCMRMPQLNPIYCVAHSSDISTNVMTGVSSVFLSPSVRPSPCL